MMRLSEDSPQEKRAGAAVLRRWGIILRCPEALRLADRLEQEAREDEA